jgi:hypothetical protein
MLSELPGTTSGGLPERKAAGRAVLARWFEHGRAVARKSWRLSSLIRYKCDMPPQCIFMNWVVFT